ncbi:XRE family transcriptional regulator [Nodularia phage vB_NspS-kac65v162]|jgi:transcriptional regulator with XRE-family HTH domain|uniref:XRE family transcriptional regulator n=6 Tax=Ravarandavirus TaxID=2843444 RepID=A0A482MKB4_9CAUD|nr:HTH domain protein [Nodularia phage vB_NpeS-2AV2]YP_009844701.1 XRE family transcriptional regulator [Nodularia phage vB_NspS-kac65v151]YP_009844909.1 XRE family transcriptional regulator [Nodularia phage vB_NspS-kac68v161]QBQ73336.1 XRE family transcriptional regulator [Nodularia phage vB_NspS-kac65v161]QBQ73542.1 XRE family transcriptional regulator [Nodularia phage vB_NspS-kac65v162]QBQ73946.1 XRE family transcriptional regulator [Nodularia phage vB_NspS-kac68v162]ALY07537.1 HTH domain 
MIDLQNLPKHLIDLRHQLGWSQQVLADQLGLHRQQIARWERTQYQTISLAKLVKVQEVLAQHVSKGNNA